MEFRAKHLCRSPRNLEPDRCRLKSSKSCWHQLIRPTKRVREETSSTLNAGDGAFSREWSVDTLNQKNTSRNYQEAIYAEIVPAAGLNKCLQGTSSC